MLVQDVSAEAVFVDDSVHVAELNKLYGTAFESFFFTEADGEYTGLWGMFGIVPVEDKLVFQVCV